MGRTIVAARYALGVHGFQIQRSQPHSTTRSQGGKAKPMAKDRGSPGVQEYIMLLADRGATCNSEASKLLNFSASKVSSVNNLLFRKGIVRLDHVADGKKYWTLTDVGWKDRGGNRSIKMHHHKYTLDDILALIHHHSFPLGPDNRVPLEARIKVIKSQDREPQIMVSWEAHPKLSKRQLSELFNHIVEHDGKE
ncbi:MAG: hypothetical protein ACWGQW_02525 [bacterium]